MMHFGSRSPARQWHRWARNHARASHHQKCTRRIGGNFLGVAAAAIARARIWQFIISAAKIEISRCSQSEVCKKCTRVFSPLPRAMTAETKKRFFSALALCSSSFKAQKSLLRDVNEETWPTLKMKMSSNSAIPSSPSKVYCSCPAGESCLLLCVYTCQCGSRNLRWPASAFYQVINIPGRVKKVNFLSHPALAPPPRAICLLISVKRALRSNFCRQHQSRFWKIISMIAPLSSRNRDMQIE